MKKIIIVLTLLAIYSKVNSQEKGSQSNEIIDSVKFESETISKVIDPDRLIILPTEDVWTYGTGIAYFLGGNVGVGTSAPSYKLQIQGDIYANGGWLRVSGTKGLYFESYGGGFYMNDATWIRTYNNKSFYHNSGIMRTDGTFQVGPNGNRFIVNTTGNIGIGCDPNSTTLKIYKSSMPTFELANSISRLQIGIASNDWDFAAGSKSGDAILRNLGSTHNIILNLPNDNNDGNSYVGFGDEANNIWFKVFNNKTVRLDGKLYATEIEVKTNVWSDYVFKENYNLRTISELERYVIENKHLPEVPSEKEVIEKGINLGEMDNILLKKIEELTLYIIDLKKENDELKELFYQSISK